MGVMGVLQGYGGTSGLWGYFRVMGVLQGYGGTSGLWGYLRGYGGYGGTSGVMGPHNLATLILILFPNKHMTREVGGVTRMMC